MNADAVSNDLAAAGIVLRLDGDRLACTAPAGTLTPERVAAIKAYRRELRQMLSEAANAAYAPDRSTSSTSHGEKGISLPPRAGSYTPKKGAMNEMPGANRPSFRPHESVTATPLRPTPPELLPGACVGGGACAALGPCARAPHCLIAATTPESCGDAAPVLGHPETPTGIAS